MNEVCERPFGMTGNKEDVNLFTARTSGKDRRLGRKGSICHVRVHATDIVPHLETIQMTKGAVSQLRCIQAVAKHSQAFLLFRVSLEQSSIPSARRKRSPNFSLRKRHIMALLGILVSPDWAHH